MYESRETGTYCTALIIWLGAKKTFTGTIANRTMLCMMEFLMLQNMKLK